MFINEKLGMLNQIKKGYDDAKLLFNQGKSNDDGQKLKSNVDELTQAIQSEQSRFDGDDRSTPVVIEKVLDYENLAKQGIYDVDLGYPIHIYHRV